VAQEKGLLPYDISEDTVILLMKYMPRHGREKKRKMRVLPTQGQSEESIISKIK